MVSRGASWWARKGSSSIGRHAAADTLGDDRCHVPDPLDKLGDATRLDPVTGGSDFQGGYHGGALIEHGHRPRAAGGLLLAEGSGEAALADSGEFLEQEIHSNDGVRCVW